MTFNVTKIDRCSTNTLEFLKLQDILFKQNILFVALDLPTSVDLATNKLIATLFLGLLNLKTTDAKTTKARNPSCPARRQISAENSDLKL